MVNQPIDAEVEAENIQFQIVEEQEKDEDGEDDFVGVDIGNILELESNNRRLSGDQRSNSESSDDEHEVRLPRNLRCPFHSMNLMATTEIQMAEDTRLFQEEVERRNLFENSTE